MFTPMGRKTLLVPFHSNRLRFGLRLRYSRVPFVDILA